MTGTPLPRTMWSAPRSTPPNPVWRASASQVSARRARRTHARTARPTWWAPPPRKRAALARSAPRAASWTPRQAMEPPPARMACARRWARSDRPWARRLAGSGPAEGGWGLQVWSRSTSPPTCRHAGTPHSPGTPRRNGATRQKSGDPWVTVRQAPRADVQRPKRALPPALACQERTTVSLTAKPGRTSGGPADPAEPADPRTRPTEPTGPTRPGHPADPSPAARTSRTRTPREPESCCPGTSRT